MQLTAEVARSDAMSLPLIPSSGPSKFKATNATRRTLPSQRSSRSLFSVDEESDTECLSEFSGTDTASHGGVASRAASLPTVPRKHKQRSASTNTKTPMQLVRILADDAIHFTETGQEQRALEAYRQATKIAGSEISRLNVRIAKSRRLHATVRSSVQDRLSEDLSAIGVAIGNFRMQMAILYDRLGSWEKALLCCREALEVYKHQPTIKNPHTKVPSSESSIQAMEAMIEGLEGVTHALRARGAHIQKMDELRDELQHTVEEDERKYVYGEIQKLAESMLSAEIGVLGSSHAQIADTLQMLSTVALERGNHTEAVEYLLKATQIGLECLGKKHPRIGQYYLRLARIEISQGRRREALATFQKAIVVLFHSPRFCRTIGAAYNDIATIYIEQNEIDLALENLHCAVKQFEKPVIVDGKTQESAASESLQVYRSMGRCYMRKFDFPRARESFAKVLALQKNSRKVYDNVRDMGLGMVGVEDSLIALVDDENVAESHVDLGRALAGDQMHEPALACFEDALKILNELEFSSQTEKMLNRNRLASKTLYCVGEEACAVGRHDRALQAYNESVRLMVLLTGSEETTSSLVHRLLCFLGIGKVHNLRNDYSAALKIYGRALKQCKTHLVPPGHPIVRMTKEKIAEVKAKIENSHNTEEKDELMQLEAIVKQNIRSGEFDLALRNIKEALKIRREKIVKLKALKADLSDEISGVANLLESFGFVYAKQGDIENSGRAFSEAYKLRSHYDIRQQENKS